MNKNFDFKEKGVVRLTPLQLYDLYCSVTEALYKGDIAPISLIDIHPVDGVHDDVGFLIFKK